MEEVKKQGMESNFVPYQIALDMKSIGFDEPCFGYYNGQGNYIGEEGKMNSNCNKLGMYDAYCTVLLYEQAFRWLYQKLDIKKAVMPLDVESQQLLLKELIDKVSSKHSLV